MQEFISIHISNVYELVFIIIWLTYGVAFGFNNWFKRLVCVFSYRTLRQSSLGTFSDMLFVVSAIGFIMFKQGYFNF